MARTVWITGAGRGVGLACALAFARLRDRVALTARTAAELEAAAEACDAAGAARALAVAADLTNEADVARAEAAIRGALGPVEVLCHGAGGARTQSFVKTDSALWNEMLCLNLTSAFFAARAALPEMLEARRGAIVFIGSTASRAGYRYCSAYVASKHGLLGMARSLAAEVAKSNITVNVVAPGYLDVDATRRAAGQIAARTGRPVGDVLGRFRLQSPQDRLFSPEEVAATAVFLASEAARGIHGQCITIDGGEIC